MARHGKRKEEVYLCVHKEQLKIKFKQHDNNHDGRLDRKELKEAFKELGAIFPNWRAARAVCYADSDKDGFISEQELDVFVNYAAKKGYCL